MGSLTHSKPLLLFINHVKKQEGIKQPDIGYRYIHSIIRIIGDLLSKRPLTTRYIIFYILFLPDAWQVFIGLIAACFIAPLVNMPDMGYGARAVLFIMIGTIGYAASRTPARWVTQILKKWILGDKRP
jgi:hypothetical protein